MTPPNVLVKTIEQVSKIMRSPGCRYVRLYSQPAFLIPEFIVKSESKTPVFVKSVETAVEVSQVFAMERWVVRV